MHMIEIVCRYDRHVGYDKDYMYDSRNVYDRDCICRTVGMFMKENLYRYDREREKEYDREYRHDRDWIISGG